MTINPVQVAQILLRHFYGDFGCAIRYAERIAESSLTSELGMEYRQAADYLRTTYNAQGQRRC